MAAREKQHHRSKGADPAPHTVSTRRYVFRRFTSWAAVSKQLPIWAPGTDLGRGETLILAVVPFEQIRIDFGHSPEAGQLTRPGRALQGTRKYLSKIHSAQSLPEGTGILFAALRQG